MKPGIYPRKAIVRITQPGHTSNGATASIAVETRPDSAVVIVQLDGGFGRLRTPYAQQQFNWNDLELVATASDK
ncbi:MAG: hypothetical protein M9918_25895 [Anaerolineae bacterium]|nr:hypothetical protein [Anaerolineae bacterium]